MKAKPDASSTDGPKPPAWTPRPDCPRCRGKGFLYRQNSRGRVVAVPCELCKSEEPRSWKEF